MEVLINSIKTIFLFPNEYFVSLYNVIYLKRLMIDMIFCLRSRQKTSIFVVLRISTSIEDFINFHVQKSITVKYVRVNNVFEDGRFLHLAHWNCWTDQVILPLIYFVRKETVNRRNGSAYWNRSAPCSLCEVICMKMRHQFTLILVNSPLIDNSNLFELPTKNIKIEARKITFLLHSSSRQVNKLMSVSHRWYQGKKNKLITIFFWAFDYNIYS